MISFPFDSVITEYTPEGYPIYDRPSDASELRRLFKETFSNGIYPNITSCLQVVENTGMKVTVKAGACLINGAIGYEELDRTMSIEASDSQDRIDRVIARLNDNKDSRKIDLYILKGTASSNPQPATLTRNESVYDICLATLYINANSTEIKQTKITDTRLDSEVCGVVTVLTKVDTTGLYEQYQASLDEYLEIVQSAIDGTTAGELTNRIVALETSLSEIESQVKSTMKNITVQPSEWVDGVYTLLDDLITATSNQEFLPPILTSSNQAEIEALQAANLQDYGQSVGQVKIKCMGDVPTITVHLRVIFRGEK